MHGSSNPTDGPFGGPTGAPRGAPPGASPGSPPSGAPPHIEIGVATLQLMGTVEGESRIRRLSWKGEKIWSAPTCFEVAEGVFAKAHHDWQREGNPVGYYAPGQDFDDTGKTLLLTSAIIDDPKVCETVPIVDDIVFEIDSEGRPTGFEWHSREHIDELGFDEAALAVIRDPKAYATEELAWEFFDWTHANTVSLLGDNKWYSERGDERFHPSNIMMSFRQMGITIIISRDTGAVVWRIGPDYEEGSVAHRLGPIVGQHMTHIIPRGLPGAGNVLLFDNGGGSGYGGELGFPRYKRDYSRVIEFDPVTLELVWEYTADGFYSTFISGAQRLPNGNTLICEGVTSRVFEVTTGREKVWEAIAGKTTVDNPGACAGYTLLTTTVDGEPRATLIDMSGTVLNTWDMNNAPAKMLPDGSVMGIPAHLGAPPPGDGPGMAPPPPPGILNIYRALRIPPDWVPGNPSGYPEWAELSER